jgi:hypothetical protein
VFNKRIKALKEIERDKTWVACAYNKENHFKLEIWFGTIGLARCLQVGKVNTKLSKLGPEICIS